MKCYISLNGNSVEEVTEFECIALFGDNETHPYATKQGEYGWVEV